MSDLLLNASRFWSNFFWFPLLSFDQIFEQIFVPLCGPLIRFRRIRDSASLARWLSHAHCWVVPGSRASILEQKTFKSMSGLNKVTRLRKNQHGLSSILMPVSAKTIFILLASIDTYSRGLLSGQLLLAPNYILDNKNVQILNVSRKKLNYLKKIIKLVQTSYK